MSTKQNKVGIGVPGIFYCDEFVRFDVKDLYSLHKVWSSNVDWQVCRLRTSGLSTVTCRYANSTVSCWIECCCCCCWPLYIYRCCQLMAICWKALLIWTCHRSKVVCKSTIWFFHTWNRHKTPPTRDFPVPRCQKRATKGRENLWPEFCAKRISVPHFGGNTNKSLVETQYK